MIIDTKLLEKQIDDLLTSNINEDSKVGLHNLLGEILDEAIRKEQIGEDDKEIIKTLKRHLKGLEKCVRKIERK